MALDLEKHFRHKGLRRSALQCGLAGGVALLVLLALDAVTQTVLIASLGASAFIAFAVPHSMHSGARNLIGGYVIGIASGCLLSVIDTNLPVTNPTSIHILMVVFGAMAISLAMFLMVVTRTEHPPAAALAIGLVLNEWNLVTLVVVLAGIVTIALIKRLVLPMLMDLI